MRRLYWHIYLTVVGVLVLFAIANILVWAPRENRFSEARMMPALALTVDEYLPGADEPPEALEGALRALEARFGIESAVRRGDEIIAASDPETARFALEFDLTRSDVGFRRHYVRLDISDDRVFIARHLRPQWMMRLGGAGAFIALLALAVGVGAYPLVRRITRRLERLHESVDELAGGDLSARVQVEGHDEIAKIATSFNRAADRIEQLVEAQRGLLASASHELRTPLTRLRLAIELLAEEARPDVRERIVRDIEELDELVGEILLASKLDGLEGLEREEELDWLAIVAEEAARVGAETRGEAVTLRGDARMLRRLVRNLFENAKRYGAGTPIEAVLEATSDGRARLAIMDRGPGVPEEEREKIFEPFYRPVGTRETADGGVGLGLALVDKIARHHGGLVRCVGREGGGTRFEVELPVVG